MKKILALVLALCLCFCAAACSSAEPAAPTAGTEPTALPSSDAEPETSVVLNVWAIESPSITDYATNRQSLWMEEQTGISINWMAVPQNGWYNAFQASVMGGEDVHVYCYPFDTMETEMLGTQMSYIIPLEDLITQENTPNIWAILEADPDLKSLITAPDGHIYTLFSNDVYNLSAYTQKLWVNRQFLEQYTAETGNGMPETTGAFVEMLTYFNTHDMNGNGVQDEVPYLGQSGVDGMYNLFGSFIPANSNGNGYGCYEAENGETVFAFAQDTFKDALAYIQGLYSQGLIHPDSFTINSSEIHAYTSGSRSDVRVGVVSGVNIENFVQLNSGENTITYDDYIALPPMEGPQGVRTIMTTGESTVSLRNAITAKCPDPAAAMKWLDAGYSETARMYAVYGGLENTDWTYTDGETISGSGQMITALNSIEENACWKGQGISYRVTEQDYQMMDISQIATNAGLATYRANLAYRPYAVVNNWPPIVWVGEQQDIAMEYSELSSLIQTTVTEYYTDVILGRKNLTTDWDAYLQTLSEIGIDRFVELVSLYSISTE